MKKSLLLALTVCGVLAAANASAASPELEEAYKQGAADWDRGDVSSAMIPLRKAADGGHAGAQALLGFLLDQADWDAEAAEYYRKAMAQDNAEGMFGLAGLYAGGYGVKQDKAEARNLYARAADAGHPQAKVVLANAYMQGGLDVAEADKTSSEALKWLRAAGEVDHLPSLYRLIDVYQRGEMGASPDPAEVARLQAKVQKLVGTDPNAQKKRRRR